MVCNVTDYLCFLCDSTLLIFATTEIVESCSAQHVSIIPQYCFCVRQRQRIERIIPTRETETSMDNSPEALLVMLHHHKVSVSGCRV